jgi:hypothetical protein
MPSPNGSKIGRFRAVLLDLLAEHQRDEAIPTSALEAELSSHSDEGQ